jgi:hypothetical protein
MLRWTILVPLTVKPAHVDLFRPSVFQVLHSPRRIPAAPRRGRARTPRERERPYARWLLVVAVGFTAIVYP